ncbi:nitrate- and nitrite sensing domain-containing protein [Streptomyces sp. NPDC051940]|uniref:sensor histidine kinase n=1 Tax=Streptomyces sp. NPDC051940 TaxID=3155675 RepID=UPI003429DB71
MRTPGRTPANGSQGPGPQGPENRPPRTGAPPVPQPAPGRRRHAGPPADETGTEPPWDATHLPPKGADTGASGETLRPDGARKGPRLRPRTVRAKVISVLMVPVVSLIALWGYATVTTAQDVARLQTLQEVDTQVRGPLSRAVAELQNERLTAARYLAGPGTAPWSDLSEQAQATDTALAALRLGDTHTVAEGKGLPKTAVDRLEAFVAAGGQLDGLRTAAQRGDISWYDAYEQYNEAIDKALTVGGSLSSIQDTEASSEARVLLEFARAGEMLARENALITWGRLKGSLDTREHRAFVGAAATRAALESASAADLHPRERAAWQELTSGQAYGQLRTLEAQIVAATPGARAAKAVSGPDWERASGEVLTGFDSIAQDAARAAADRSDPLADGVLTVAGAAVLFGLLAVIAALVISVRVGRGLVVELISLRNSALALARRKLPSAMRRLRAGEDLDIEKEAPLGMPGEDEIAQVADALNTVHRAALLSAVERAELASGISGVFVNLARRSQVLVHRQLALLDSMERRADDPGELEDLFRLDHLTTRMRRHAESLIILSGAAPGRAWRMPVPLQNVVRAAVSEVEDYARIEVRTLPEQSVIGAAVADLTHLLAELVENAAQFSPPHTKVRVYGEQVGNGYAIEIEDRGLGMGKETLEAANHRIEQSETLDLFDSDRLGLFVVSRLAARHDIKVSLRASPYGGTTVVVLLPRALLQVAGDPPPKDDGTGGTPAPEETPLRERMMERVREPVHAGPVLTPGTPRPALAPQLPAEPAGDDVLQLPQRKGRRPLSAKAVPAPGAAPVAPPAPPARAPQDTGLPADDTDLPRRVRQASLAPQLRDVGKQPSQNGTGSPPAPAPAPRDRSPEEARARMAAYRSGWVRGGGLTAGRPKGAAKPGGRNDDTTRDREGDQE